MNTTHVFTETGNGAAPFTFLGVRENVFRRPDGTTQAGGCCDHCGTGIRYEYLLRSADGYGFVVGSDCIAKTGDKGLIDIAKAEVRKRRRWQERQRAEARREAWLHEQRERNGGLTDWEVQERKRAEREARIAEATADDWAFLADFAHTLRGASNGHFAPAIADQIERHSVPTDRAINVAVEIVAKTCGRKGSTAFIEAHDELMPKVRRAFAHIAEVNRSGGEDD